MGAEIPNTNTILFFFLFFTVVSVALYTDEADYMRKLKKALTPLPPDWSNDTDICQWTGVDCDGNEYVNTIDLSSMSIRGTIPSGLNSLSSLTNLDLGSNALSGPLPSLANLTYLQVVRLHLNNFTSIPPACFQGLTNLQTLNLRDNINLPPWTFPTDLSHSWKLNTLDLSATNLMGSIPDIFHSFPILQTLNLSNNNLTGLLPNSFARTQVARLWLDSQHYGLSGTIQVLSSMPNLTIAFLWGNSFEGPIPDLSNCTNLQYLYLDDNRLTGVVPNSLLTLPDLVTLSLKNNYLQGPMPVFAKGVDASLGNNNTNGFCSYTPGPCDRRVTILLQVAQAFGYPYQLALSWRGNDPCHNWSFVVCAPGGQIKTVNLTNLNLTGTVSPAFANLTDLQELHLDGNHLTGSIPKSFTNLPYLRLLDVSYNNLSGDIPKFSPSVTFIDTGNVLLGLSQVNRTTSSLWIAGASVAGVGSMVIFLLVIYNRKGCLNLIQKMVGKKTGTSEDNKFEDLIKSFASLSLKRYSYSQVKRMTNSFRDKLGQGGYGIVYKASLSDGCQVAVKVLNDSGGSREEFINEVASISRTSHVNIVSLLGFCYEKNKRALIYEFMPNGSLDKFIYKQGSLTPICNLGWTTLFQITISIARGLEYLHRGCNTRILHLDIKPQNILLDDDFCPKIADFGLAKIFKKKESVVSITGTRGTPGYIAPEVFSRAYGGVSQKSDVYSYGMLILEVVGGRKNYDTGGSNTSEMYFPDWIFKDIEQGNITARHLTNTEEENDMLMKITLVSLWCIQPNPAERPSMSKVIEMLEGSLESVPYPPKPSLYSPEFSNVSYSGMNETISTTEEGE